MAMVEQRVRLHPRISANKLGEYMVSPPLRRQSIIERQKYPCTYIGAYYEPAHEAIVDFIVGRSDRGGLLRRTEQIVEGPHESTWAMHRAHGSAEAVLRFLDLEPALVVLVRPAEIADRADIDETRLGLFLRKGAGRKQHGGRCGKRE